MNKPEEGSDVPVLTQVVEVAEIDRVTAVALHSARMELTANVAQMVREAVATSLAQALAVPKRD
jgi:hypothetical protein